ncbi:TRAP transporter large permease subunit [Amycolatopsis marina]|uniref:TRAP transporter large permease n=1 Tax=Amycolatopsis marina TaxID=490629 RepID=UPI0015A69661|nr:TRAP transporter large permease subunit [Amycolatopsis marina]
MAARRLGWLGQLTGLLGGVAVVLLLTTVLVDVTLRFAFSKPLPGTIEYVSFWYMTAIGFLGLALAERHGEHIDAPIVFDRLPGPIRRELIVIAKVLFAVVMIAIAVWGWEEAVRQWEIGERGAAAGVVLWPARFLVPLGAAACVIEIAAGLLVRQHVSRSDENISSGQVADGRKSKTGEWMLRLLNYGLPCLVTVLMFQDQRRETIGALGLGLMLWLLVMKIPVAIAMIASGGVGIWALTGLDVLGSTFRTVPFSSVASWPLSVVPMFVFMGLLLWRSGATERLYDASRHWLGWLPGGLAVGTNFAGAGLASISGSTLGVTYALGRIGIPEMLRHSYDPRLATATILMAGTGGQLIPPSILLVIYAGIASVPVGVQLLAGLLPGIILTLVYGILLVTIGVAAPRLVGRFPETDRGAIRSSWLQRWASLGRVWPLFVLAIGMLGGLYLGFFTATEAGAFGAAGALLVATLRRTGIRSAVGKALGDTVKTCGAIFALIIGATVLSRFLTLSGVASWMVRTVSDLDLSRYQFLFALLAMYLILGMFLDSLTMILVTVPILLPILQSLDVSLIWFGVFVVLLGELAVVTPPVGMLTFVVHKITQAKDIGINREIKLGEIYAGTLWFIPISIAVLVLLIFVPEIAEIIPRMSGQ